MYYFDTETFLISPGNAAPRMVCAQYARNEDEPTLVHAKDPKVHDLLENALSEGLSGHNVAYDAAVICAFDPDRYLRQVFDSYRNNRIVCTVVRAKLIDIALGLYSPKRLYNLGICLERTDNGFKVDKEDPWRLRYGSLYDTDVENWPQEALAYALKDAEAQRILHQWQEQHSQYLEDQYRQSRAAFWIRLMECWGILTDSKMVDQVYEWTLEDSERDRVVVTEAGLVRPDGSRDTKVAMARMVEVMTELGEDIPVTNSGQKLIDQSGITPEQLWAKHGKYVSLDEDSCLASGDPVLLAYQRFGSYKTTLTRIERLRNPLIQASFNSLVETGRTSCRQGDHEDSKTPSTHGFQLQNTPRHAVDVNGKERPGINECFIPRPGFLFSSVDYDSFELKTWSQCCLWSVGYSRMAEVLNAGKDPHTELGARLAKITKEEAYAIVHGERGPEAKKHFKDDHRQTAKIGNFGLPGGMGAKAMRTQARTQYRVFMSLEEAYALVNAWRAEWPEAKLYFDWINRMGDGSATVRHFVSGRIRGNIPYTVRCNTFFQGLAADAAKEAGWYLAEECYLGRTPDGRESPLYGSRIVNFRHDEYILEIPEDCAHDAAMRQAEIMCTVAQRWVPDVKITATPALMRRWTKGAEANYNENGRLIPHEIPEYNEG